MLHVVAFFFGPLLLLVGLICRDAMASPDGQQVGGGGSDTNPAHYVMLVALAVCFVWLLALAGRTS